MRSSSVVYLFKSITAKYPFVVPFFFVIFKALSSAVVSSFMLRLVGVGVLLVDVLCIKPLFCKQSIIKR